MRVQVCQTFLSGRIWKHQWIFTPVIFPSALGAGSAHPKTSVGIFATPRAAPSPSPVLALTPRAQRPRNSLKSVSLYTSTATCIQKHMVYFETIFFNWKSQTKPESTHQYLVAENLHTIWRGRMGAALSKRLSSLFNARFYLKIDLARLWSTEWQYFTCMLKQY